MSRNLIAISMTAGMVAGTASADVPSVAVDIAPVHSLVARVMDGVGVPDLIVAAGASPHEYSLRPSEAQALQDADLVFWIGEDLTPWMEGAIEALAEGSQVTSLLGVDGTLTLPFRESALFEAHAHGDEHGDEHADEHGDEHGDEHADEHGDEHGDEHADEHGDEHGDEHADEHGDEHADEHGDEHKEDAHDHDAHDHDEDHHAGHGHGEIDPHAWLSPENAAVWLNAIAAALSGADPENAGTYFANAAAGRAELEVLSQDVSEILDPLRGRNFIVFHDAYQYFEDAFEFPAAGAISVSDASDPSPARIAEIQGRVAEQGVACVLSEPQYAPGIVAAVMDGSTAQTAVVDPLGSDLDVGPGLYPQLIRNLASKFAECL